MADDLPRSRSRMRFQREAPVDPALHPASLRKVCSVQQSKVGATLGEVVR